MPTTAFKRVESEDDLSRLRLGDSVKARGVIAWSSLFFALLQSVCTFFAALDGLRVVIGVGALANVIAAGHVWDKFHTDSIRVPMVGLAVAGAVLNLAILRRVWRLRQHPAAQWRQAPVSARKMRMERVQLVLSLITIGLVLLEEMTHWRTFHRL
jgi:hypothetical protein